MKKSSKSAYKNQAKKFLENSFPRISCAAIDSVLNHVDFQFPEAFAILSRIQQELPNGDGKDAFPQMPPNIRVFLKNDRSKKRHYVRNEKLRDEIATINELNTKPPADAAKADPIPDLIAKENVAPNATANDPDEEEDDDNLLECGCCYGDYEPPDMKECAAGAGHNVCKECISRFVSEQLDGNDSVVFKCIVDDQCTCTYPVLLLDQVLTPKLKKRTNDRIFREEIKNSGLNVWCCPSCAYMGFSEQQFSTMMCPECDVFYCTSCNEVEHGKRTCDEVRQEKERLRNPVHRAHEVMSQAVKRRCPRCAKEFLKSDGCNKMKCTCGTLSCYLCGAQVQNYSHFCNHKKPCPCGKPCELFTSTGNMEKLDRKQRRDAGRKVLEEAGLDEQDILRVLASPQKKKAAPPVRVVNNRPVQPQVQPAPRALGGDNRAAAREAQRVRLLAQQAAAARAFAQQAAAARALHPAAVNRQMHPRVQPRRAALLQHQAAAVAQRRPADIPPQPAVAAMAAQREQAQAPVVNVQPQVQPPARVAPVPQQAQLLAVAANNREVAAEQAMADAIPFDPAPEPEGRGVMCIIS